MDDLFSWMKKGHPLIMSGIFYYELFIEVFKKQENIQVGRFRRVVAGLSEDVKGGKVWNI